MLRKVFCTMLIGMMVFAIVGIAAEPEKENDAVAVAEKWLALIDAGKYAEGWTEGAQLLQNVIKQEDFGQALKGVRAPLGKLVSRKLTKTTYATTLPGVPDGEYVVIVFETVFENKQHAVETVTPMLDKEGLWKVSGYYIK